MVQIPYRKSATKQVIRLCLKPLNKATGGINQRVTLTPDRICQLSLCHCLLVHFTVQDTLRQPARRTFVPCHPLPLPISIPSHVFNVDIVNVSMSVSRTKSFVTDSFHTSNRTHSNMKCSASHLICVYTLYRINHEAWKCEVQTLLLSL